MKAVRVQYVVKPEYVAQNQANIKAVMEDLRENPIEGMNYSTFYLGDGHFMHLNVSANNETNALLGQREKFNEFRNQLKASEPISPPKSEDLELVGSNVDFI